MHTGLSRTVRATLRGVSGVQRRNIAAGRRGKNKLAPPLCFARLTTIQPIGGRKCSRAARLGPICGLGVSALTRTTGCRSARREEAAPVSRLLPIRPFARGSGSRRSPALPKTQPLLHRQHHHPRVNHLKNILSVSASACFVLSRLN
jgi:hypothetical protein